MIQSSKNPTTKIFDTLKGAIIAGEYPPLAPLNEVKLSSQYGVSRNTVKKALLMLENENLVSIELNKGAKVKSVSLEEVKELLELRATLERFIVGKTVPVISQNDIARMAQILQTMKQRLDERNLLDYSKHNHIFHDIIYKACPNKAAVEMTTRLKVLMRRYDSKTILVPGRDVTSFAEHTAILKAFQDRDVQSAEKLIEQHVMNVKKTLEENLSLLFIQ